jgi:cell division septum initiation protein DivIVA
LLQKNESLEQKNGALEQKLNELKNIEKTMNQRSTKTDNKP